MIKTIKKLIWGKGRTRIQKFKGQDGNWYWRAKAGNGEELAKCSEGNGYSTKQMMEKGLEATKKAFLEWNIEDLTKNTTKK